jgi:homoserine/homoserine lactone efflux protein
LNVELWLAFCLLEVVLCLTPGPAVLSVVSAAMRGGRGQALATALGILAGNASYFLLSATGVAALIAASPRAFAGLRWAGAAYLFWLGLRLMWPHAAGAAVMNVQTLRSGRTWRSGVVRGWLVQISNPKALVFFAALLPQFIDPRFAAARQLLVLGISSVCIEWCVLWGYAALAARARQLARPRLVRVFEVAGGCCLLAIAARIAVGR